MEYRPLGKTGLKVSRLGAGLGEIGDLTTHDVTQASRVLNAALDGGITFLDTAECYGVSEELIGLSIAHRRGEYALATKCGHAFPGGAGQEWTPQLIAKSIDHSLRLLKTDHLDLIQLHSCGVDVLERGEVIEAVRKAKEAGKARFIGYSGDNEAARWAVDSGIFDTLQTSFNLADQRARKGLLQAAKARGMGVIAKRPIANGVWGARRSPSVYAVEYFQRAQAMLKEGPVPGAPADPVQLAMGFAFAHDEVDTAIVGSRDPAHMQANIRTFESGVALPKQTLAELHRRFDALGKEWGQET